jgi:hypothetical protein
MPARSPIDVRLDEPRAGLRDRAVRVRCAACGITAIVHFPVAELQAARFERLTAEVLMDLRGCPHWKGFRAEELGEPKAGARNRRGNPPVRR